jgi:hypothetical protein
LTYSELQKYKKIWKIHHYALLLQKISNQHEKICIIDSFFTDDDSGNGTEYWQAVFVSRVSDG